MLGRNDLCDKTPLKSNTFDDQILKCIYNIIPYYMYINKLIVLDEKKKKDGIAQKNEGNFHWFLILYLILLL